MSTAVSTARHERVFALKGFGVVPGQLGEPWTQYQLPSVESAVAST